VTFDEHPDSPRLGTKQSDGTERAAFQVQHSADAENGEAGPSLFYRRKGPQNMVCADGEGTTETGHATFFSKRGKNGHHLKEVQRPTVVRSGTFSAREADAVSLEGRK